MRFVSKILIFVWDLPMKAITKKENLSRQNLFDVNLMKTNLKKMDFYKLIK